MYLLRIAWQVCHDICYGLREVVHSYSQITTVERERVLLKPYINQRSSKTYFQLTLQFGYRTREQSPHMLPLNNLTA